MNTVLPINPGLITTMTCLSRRPVCFLRMNGALQPNLVVKGEARAGTHPGMPDDEALVSIKGSSNLMKSVNNPLDVVAFESTSRGTGQETLSGSQRSGSDPRSLPSRA
jgi:hypothetical protein